jgi:SOS-response transcriptional repressor LexA
MGWAIGYIVKLKEGRTVQFRPRGHSMRGKVDSGDLVTVEPVDTAALAVGDIVLCKVRGREYLHLIKAIKGSQFLIGNNRGFDNGWISANQVFGKCTKIER